MAVILAICLAVISGVSTVITGNFYLITQFFEANLLCFMLGIGSISALIISALFFFKPSKKTCKKYNCTGVDIKPKIISVCDLGIGFEEEREELWSSYHSQIQSHVGYAITTLIAFAGLLASSNFFIQVPFLSLLTLGASLVCAVFFGYLVLRILYWSNWEGTAMLLSNEQIVEYFNFCNAHGLMYDCYDSITASAIIQTAIKQHLIDQAAKKERSITACIRKLALITGGMMGIPTDAEPKIGD